MKDFSKYVLAAKRDFHDHRDIMKVAKPVSLPPSAFTRYVPPVKDQGQRSSCTGHAYASFLEQVLISRGMNVQVQLAPLFVWFFARQAENVAGQDEGVQLRSIMQAGLERGVCPEEFWPHSSPIAREPSIEADAYAAALKIPEYQRCGELKEIKYSIAIEDQSVVLGGPVFEEWYSEAATKTGLVFYNGGFGKTPLGGHAFLGIGYDDAKVIPGNEPGAVKCRNSWSEEYGDLGDFWLPYEYFDTEAFDAFTAGYESLPDAK